MSPDPFIPNFQICDPLFVIIMPLPLILKEHWFGCSKIPLLVSVYTLSFAFVYVPLEQSTL